MATWYISWHTAICLSVVSLPSRLFKLEVDDCNVPQGPDWRRLTILFLWYLAGVPVAYVMYDPCSVGAPGTWARATRVFIEGMVAFGLGGFIYVGICPFLTAHWGDIYPQFPTHVRRYPPLPKRPPLFYQARPSPLVLQNLCDNVLLGKGYRLLFKQPTVESHPTKGQIAEFRRPTSTTGYLHGRYRVDGGNHIASMLYPEKHAGTP
ncbi:hypothetical protein BJV78DRAFT_1151779 [Lactifluus subvellereus]|nr:hypothetical protein BJV78DRAFT_1151779 [Lactifluus subvellereus]